MSESDEVNIPIRWVTFAVHNEHIYGLVIRETRDVKNSARNDERIRIAVPAVEKGLAVWDLQWIDDGYGLYPDVIQDRISDAKEHGVKPPSIPTGLALPQLFSYPGAIAVEDLELDPRLTDIIKDKGVDNVCELLQISRKEWLATPNMTTSYLIMLEEALEGYDAQLQP